MDNDHIEHARAMIRANAYSNAGDVTLSTEGKPLVGSTILAITGETMTCMISIDAPYYMCLIRYSYRNGMVSIPVSGAALNILTDTLKGAN